MGHERVVTFGHLPITVDDDVLTPRPWTVTQSIWAAELLRHTPPPGAVLELCAGAGQIGLLAMTLADPGGHRLVAVDINPAACALARRNAVTAGIADRVDVRDGAMEQVLDRGECFDLVIADPPWVERDRVDRFPADPVLAIDGGPDGLDLARQCVAIAEEHLTAGGSLLLQLGTPHQADLIDAELQHGSLAVRDRWTESGSGVILHAQKDQVRSPG